MPTFIVAGGTIKYRKRKYSQGEEILLPLGLIEQLRFNLLPPKRFYKPWQRNQKRGDLKLRTTKSLWKIRRSHLYLFKSEELRRAMTWQMGFTCSELYDVPQRKLVKMIIEKRGY